MNSGSKRVQLPAEHPLVVIYDLRRGCLSSLNLYLAKHGGIPDRGVALELRKLIGGSRYRTDYRLLVVEHPDKPVDQGGRPTARVASLSSNELAIVQRYAELFAEEKKVYLAQERAGAEFGVSKRTIARLLKKNLDLRLIEAARQERESKREAVQQRRKRALAESRLPVGSDANDDDTKPAQDT
jgi:hypothetical protein